MCWKSSFNCTLIFSLDSNWPLGRRKKKYAIMKKKKKYKYSFYLMPSDTAENEANTVIF